MMAGGRPSAQTLTGIVQACCWYTGVVSRILMTPQPSQMLFLQNNLFFLSPLKHISLMRAGKAGAEPSGPSETRERRAYGLSEKLSLMATIWHVEAQQGRLSCKI